jgi:hypothetical protein
METFKPEAQRASETTIDEASELQAFETVFMPEPTQDQRLAFYALYRQIGGAAYEPDESLLGAPIPAAESSKPDLANA